MGGEGTLPSCAPRGGLRPAHTSPHPQHVLALPHCDRDQLCRERRSREQIQNTPVIIILIIIIIAHSTKLVCIYIIVRV